MQMMLMKLKNLKLIFNGKNIRIMTLQWKISVQMEENQTLKKSKLVVLPILKMQLWDKMIRKIKEEVEFF